ncbi:hypothetical protein JCM10908_005427 [Rhodotorula pacifica]|uniref:uncharacterized protein n=1 Tax=Rhodotorula pacifica TaxID=1495444 RepID=UPI003182AB5B
MPGKKASAEPGLRELLGLMASDYSAFEVPPTGARRRGGGRGTRGSLPSGDPEQPAEAESAGAWSSHLRGDAAPVVNSQQREASGSNRHEQQHTTKSNAEEKARRALKRKQREIDSLTRDYFAASPQEVAATLTKRTRRGSTAAAVVDLEASSASAENVPPAGEESTPVELEPAVESAAATEPSRNRPREGKMEQKKAERRKKKEVATAKAAHRHQQERTQRRRPSEVDSLKRDYFAASPESIAEPSSSSSTTTTMEKRTRRSSTVAAALAALSMESPPDEPKPADARADPAGPAESSSSEVTGMPAEPCLPTEAGGTSGSDVEAGTTARAEDDDATTIASSEITLPSKSKAKTKTQARAAVKVKGKVNRKARSTKSASRSSKSVHILAQDYFSAARQPVLGKRRSHARGGESNSRKNEKVRAAKRALLTLKKGGEKGKERPPSPPKKRRRVVVEGSPELFGPDIGRSGGKGGDASTAEAGASFGAPDALRQISPELSAPTSAEASSSFSSAASTTKGPTSATASATTTAIAAALAEPTAQNHVAAASAAEVQQHSELPKKRERKRPARYFGGVDEDEQMMQDLAASAAAAANASSTIGVDEAAPPPDRFAESQKGSKAEKVAKAKKAKTAKAAKVPRKRPVKQKTAAVLAAQQPSAVLPAVSAPALSAEMATSAGIRGVPLRPVDPSLVVAPAEEASDFAASTGSAATGPSSDITTPATSLSGLSASSYPNASLPPAPTASQIAAKDSKRKQRPSSTTTTVAPLRKQDKVRARHPALDSRESWVKPDHDLQLRANGRPPIWCESRQELCESLDYFKSYQGGHYDSQERCLGYLLDGFGTANDVCAENGKVIISHGGGCSEVIDVPRAPGSSEEPQRIFRLKASQTRDNVRMRALFNCKNTQTPVILLAGTQWPFFPRLKDLGKNDEGDATVRYAVLGHYLVTHIWAEGETIDQPTQPIASSSAKPAGPDFFVRFKVRFEWVPSQGKPWFDSVIGGTPTAALTSAFGLPETDPSSPPMSDGLSDAFSMDSGFVDSTTPPPPSPSYGKIASQLGLTTCTTCQQSHPRVYEEAVSCYNEMCPDFFRLDGNMPRPDSLTYAQVLVRTTDLPEDSLVPEPLCPPTLQQLAGVPYISDYSEQAWRGFGCSACGRLSSRQDWLRLRCTGCGAETAAYGDLGLKRFGRRFGDDWQPRKADGTGPKPAYASSEYRVLPITHVRGYEGYTVELLDDADEATGVGHARVHHLWPMTEDTSQPSDELFKAYQGAEAGKLFKRNRLTRHAAVGNLLCQQFSFNSGAHYRHVIGAETYPFPPDREESQTATDAASETADGITYAPACTRDGRDHLTTVVDALKGEQFSHYTHFNEVLSVAYMTGGRMNLQYHDDGERGLGPFVASISLGSDAMMSFRRKDTKKRPRVRKTIDPSKTPSPSEAGDNDSGEEADEAAVPTSDGVKRRSNSSRVALKIRLKHGDIMLMEGEEMQRQFEHKVEPEGLRFAATARFIGSDHLLPPSKAAAAGASIRRVSKKKDKTPTAGAMPSRFAYQDYTPEESEFTIPEVIEPWMLPPLPTILPPAVKTTTAPRVVPDAPTSLPLADTENAIESTMLSSSETSASSEPVDGDSMQSGTLAEQLGHSPPSCATRLDGEPISAGPAAPRTQPPTPPVQNQAPAVLSKPQARRSEATHAPAVLFQKALASSLAQQQQPARLPIPLRSAHPPPLPVRPPPPPPPQAAVMSTHGVQSDYKPPQVQMRIRQVAPAPYRPRLPTIITPIDPEAVSIQAASVDQAAGPARARAWAPHLQFPREQWNADAAAYVYQQQQKQQLSSSSGATSTFPQQELRQQNVMDVNVSQQLPAKQRKEKALLRQSRSLMPIVPPYPIRALRPDGGAREVDQVVGRANEAEFTLGREWLGDC